MLLVRGRGAQKEGGLSQLTVFDKLAQPVLTGFGRVLRVCTHVCVCVHVSTVRGRGRVDWRSEKGVLLVYTIQQTGTY